MYVCFYWLLLHVSKHTSTNLDIFNYMVYIRICNTYKYIQYKQCNVQLYTTTFTSWSYIMFYDACITLVLYKSFLAIYIPFTKHTIALKRSFHSSTYELFSPPSRYVARSQGGIDNISLWNTSEGQHTITLFHSVSLILWSLSHWSNICSTDSVS